MSLKIFHIFFITLSTLLAAGSAWWAHTAGNMFFTIVCAAIALALPVYGVSFWRKMRRVIL